jgi:hypothetical protein
MMMRALEAGGLEAVYAPSREDMRRKYADQDYDPNEGGLYELEREQYQALDFPRAYDGKLIKCLNMGVVTMATMPRGIMVIFMRRDVEEIRQSYDAFFGKQLGMLDPETFQRRMDLTVERINNRRDVFRCTQLWYRDVVDNPLEMFTGLRDHFFCWPIDPYKAAAVVNPELCRFRREELTEGVL